MRYRGEWPLHSSSEGQGHTNGLVPALLQGEHGDTYIGTSMDLDAARGWLVNHSTADLHNGSTDDFFQGGLG